MGEELETIRVLLVDDELDFLASTAKALERRGFKVTQAASAREALAIMENRTPVDVAVLDVRLPDGDGHELFLELKKMNPQLQAIILTGNRDEYKRFSLSHKGLYDYLDKPCDVDLLARVITAAHQEDQTERIDEPAGTGEASESAPVRVLLIDDEADFLESLSRILTRRGMIVHTAISGDEGLRILDREPVDVTVLDLKMPGLSGMEVFEQIKRKRPEVEVIMLTGHATVDSGIEGVRQGAADYLLKPTEPEALIERIRHAAGKFGKPEQKRKWRLWGKKE